MTAVTSEESDNYPRIVARLNDDWRVIACRANIQWILQHRAGKRHGVARWESRSFCRTSEALNRLSRRHAGAIDPNAAAILASLPERIATNHDKNSLSEKPSPPCRTRP